MQVLGSADNGTPPSSLAAHTSDVGARKEGKEDIVQVSVDENLHAKKFLGPSFDPQKYECKEIWLIVSEADEVTNPLRSSSRKHKVKVMEALEPNK